MRVVIRSSHTRVCLLVAILPCLSTGARSEELSFDGAKLQPVPYPAVESFETQVREQLLTARQRFDQRVAEGSLEDEELGRASGELGRLYLLYDLMKPAEAAFANARVLQPQDFRWPHYLGYLLAMEGRYEAARSELEAAVALNSGYVASWIRLGNVQMELKDWQTATASFERALELDTNSAAATYGLGYIAYSRADYDRAIELLERVLELQPQADRVHYLLAMAYRERGDAELARRHLELSGQQSVRIEDPQVAALSELITGSSIHFELGTRALVRGDYALAVEEFRQVVKIEPNDYLAYYNLSLALLEGGDRSGAKAALRAALEVNSRFRNGHFNLATMAAEEGRFDEAAVHFEAAHRIDPEDEQAHLDWTTALSRTGQTQRAVEELRKLLERHPDQYEARLNLGTMLAGLGRPSEARAAWQGLLEVEVEPEYRAAAHLALAELDAESGNEERAVGHYRALLEIQPQSVEALLGLANLSGRLQRFREAADYFERVVQRAPGDVHARFGYSMALILDGQYASARRALEEGLDEIPGSVPLQHLLARLLATCPEDGVRDGARAMELAQEVIERDLTLEHAETLAMALAEQGRFDEAIDWERQVLEEAQRRNDATRIELAQSRLSLYEAGQKVRAPWRPTQ